jgi:hypothetical protein
LGVGFGLWDPWYWPGYYDYDGYDPYAYGYGYAPYYDPYAYYAPPVPVVSVGVVGRSVYHRGYVGDGNWHRFGR